MMLHGELKGAYAESISAGYSNGALVVMQLLVDDGQSDRAHRTHLLAPMFTTVGVACARHASYDVVCVLDYAQEHKQYASAIKAECNKPGRGRIETVDHRAISRL